MRRGRGASTASPCARPTSPGLPLSKPSACRTFRRSAALSSGLESHSGFKGPGVNDHNLISVCSSFFRKKCGTVCLVASSNKRHTQFGVEVPNFRGKPQAKRGKRWSTGSGVLIEPLCARALLKSDRFRASLHMGQTHCKWKILGDGA